MAEYTNKGKAPERKVVNGAKRWVMPGETVSIDGGDKPASEAKSRDGDAGDSQATDRFDNMSVEELRDYIEAETGKAPHWNASEETLREKARAI